MTDTQRTLPTPQEAVEDIQSWAYDMYQSDAHETTRERIQGDLDVLRALASSLPTETTIEAGREREAIARALKIFDYWRDEFDGWLHNEPAAASMQAGGDLLRPLALASSSAGAEREREADQREAVTALLSWLITDQVRLDSLAERQPRRAYALGYTSGSLDSAAQVLAQKYDMGDEYDRMADEAWAAVLATPRPSEPPLEAKTTQDLLQKCEQDGEPPCLMGEQVDAARRDEVVAAAIDWHLNETESHRPEKDRCGCPDCRLHRAVSSLVTLLVDPLPAPDARDAEGSEPHEDSDADVIEQAIWTGGQQENERAIGIVEKATPSEREIKYQQEQRAATDPESYRIGFRHCRAVLLAALRAPVLPERGGEESRDG